MKKTFLSGLLFALSLGAIAQEKASGFVFEDLNGNGKKERREKGIEGVAVSNGIQVVQTDAKGRYELPIGDDQIIFVIKPSGYAVPVDENNLPPFYYMHKPAGSPELKYAGVEPTGALPNSVDFALLPWEYREIFTSLIFGDPQPYTIEEVIFFADGVVAEVEGIQGVDFGISLGDLVGDDLSLFQPYLEADRKST